MSIADGYDGVFDNPEGDAFPEPVVTLREVIANSLGMGKPQWFDYEDADAILATPEMVALLDELERWRRFGAHVYAALTPETQP